MTNIRIETLTASDLGPVRALGLATPELQVVNDEPDYYSLDMLRSFIQSPNDIYLAAKLDTELLGYLLVSYNPYLKEAYFIDLVVKNEFRNQGIASRFYQKAFEMLSERGCNWAWAIVHEDNTHMMKILERKGFTKGRKFQFFYKISPF